MVLLSIFVAVTSRAYAQSSSEGFNDALTYVVKSLGVLGLAAAMALGAIKGVQMLRQGDGKRETGGVTDGDRLWLTDRFTQSRHDMRNIVGTMNTELGVISDKLDALHTLERIVELLEDIKSQRRTP